jgi:8-oxo-dGTP pyrophosphatase MutT (NUDIX family)
VLLEAVERQLIHALARPLPDAVAHVILAPRPRIGWQPGHLPDDCRRSAALLLLYPREGHAHFVLTLRNAGMPQHAGQVSFPGGAVEPGESYNAAALREAREEVGVDPLAVRVLGELSPLHIPVSRFVLHPQVAVTHRRPDLEPCSREVAKILEVPLEHLRDPERVRVEVRTFGGRQYQVPFVLLEREKVWGATAMILAEFLIVLGELPPVVPGEAHGRP